MGNRLYLGLEFVIRIFVKVYFSEFFMLNGKKFVVFVDCMGDGFVSRRVYVSVIIIIVGV